MEEVVINTIYNKADFTELYFGKRKMSIIFYKEIRIYSFFMIALIIINLVALIIAFIKQDYWFIFVLTLMIFILCLFGWVRAIKSMYDWKKSVYQFINSKLKYKASSITLTENSISVIEDSNETIVTWPDIKTVSYDENYLELTGSKEIVIFRKSMTEQEFDVINNFITRKVKNGQ